MAGHKRGLLSSSSDTKSGGGAAFLSWSLSLGCGRMNTNGGSRLWLDSGMRLVHVASPFVIINVGATKQNCTSLHDFCIIITARREREACKIPINAD